MIDYKELINQLQFWKKDRIHLIDEVIKISKEENNPNIIIELSEALINLGKYKEAIKALIQIRSEEENNSEWNYMMGVSQYELFKETDDIDDLRLSLKFLLTSDKLGNEKAKAYLEEYLKEAVKEKLGDDSWPNEI